MKGFRVQSPAFQVAFPDNNIYQYYGYDVPMGTYGPFVSDGYWLMLAPLGTGQHVVHFHGELPGFTLDITYHLTVAH